MGHEQMHAQMLLILVVSLMLAQLALLLWRRRHYRTYQFVSLVALWIVPPLLSMHAGFWRMVVLWSLYTALTLYVLYRATRRPLGSTTPRLVYAWFLGVGNATYALGIVGYALIMLSFIGLGAVWSKSTLASAGSLLLFYGIYFGVIGRDLAEICTQRMNTTMGVRCGRRAGRAGARRGAADGGASSPPTRASPSSTLTTTCARCADVCFSTRPATWTAASTGSPVITCASSSGRAGGRLAARRAERPGRFRAISPPQISRILHPRLVHCGQEANVPVLQRKGRPAGHLSELVRRTRRAPSRASCLANCTRPRTVGKSRRLSSATFSTACATCWPGCRLPWVSASWSSG